MNTNTKALHITAIMLQDSHTIIREDFLNFTVR
jgi:hypothetical protein